MEKRNATLSHQLIIVMVGIVLGTVIVCWFLNNTFLEKYYIYNKEKNINDIFTKTLKKELKKNFLIEYKSNNELSKKGNTN